jgi:YVTN family beta-propeller protein
VEAFTALVPVGYIPNQVRMHPDGAIAYVSNQDGRTISFVDVESNRETRVLPMTASILSLGLSRDGTRLYVLTDYEGVHVLDTRDGTRIATVPVGPVPVGVATHPTAPLLFVAARDGDTVTAIDTHVNAVAYTLRVAGNPQNLAIAPDGAELYVTDYARSVLHVWDLAEGTQSATVPIGTPVRRNTFDVAVSPSGRELYVGAIHDGRVFVVDRASRAIVRTIPTGGVPRYIGFDPRGRAVIPNEAGWVNFAA